MIVVCKSRMKRIEAALVSAYETITTDLLDQKIVTSTFAALSNNFANISEELGINLLEAADKTRRAIK